jgi:NDP-sugar pyrophosphorylase family protein
MEGFILAAGLGTRLRPLTDDKPKALVEVGGMTLLERTIHRLENVGIEHIVINVHHFADMVVDYIKSHRWQSRIDISDERALLLDTGGGLKHAATLFSGTENILIHNVDILSDIDLREVEWQHISDGNLVTLCVSKRDTKRLLEFDMHGRLVGRADHGLAFSGISVVSPALFALLPEADRPYPVIDEYIRLAGEGHRIGSYLHAPDHWLDVGKPETLKLAEQWTASSSK